jgi:hypothetical protein
VETHFAEHIRRLFPACPPDRAERSAAHVQVEGVLARWREPASKTD